MRVPSAIVVLGLALLAIAGCGKQSEETPSACIAGPNAYLTALEAAPEDVRLKGGVPLSECLAENQQGGELATVGGAMVETATKLNAEARHDPDGEAALRLGYLVGAAQRGADDTEGIHTDLLRRLTVAAGYSPSGKLPETITKAYEQGFTAGHENG